MLCAERKVSPILSPRQPFLFLLLLALTFTCVESDRQVIEGGDKR